MLLFRNNIIRNLIRMGKPIKRTPLTQAKPQHTKRTRTFATSTAPQQPGPQLKLEPTIVQDVRFQDLTKENLLHPTLLKTITEDMKFDKMMPVQAATLHDLLKDRVDMLAQAKTGTGKTIAFLLPAIQTIINKKKNPADISLLVISPTRELALQIAGEARELLAKFDNINVVTAIGGTNKNTEHRKMLEGCNILVGTPGRLDDHLSDEGIPELFQSLDTIVLDEADRLLDMGFTRQIEKIVRCLPNKKQTNRQGMLFSATMVPRVKECANLVLGPGYKTVSTIPEGEGNTHERVPQLLVNVPEFKDVAPAMVSSIVSEMNAFPEGKKAFKAVVFAPTAALVDFYVHILENIQGLPEVKGQHSRFSQSKRTNVSNWFRGASSGIMVATDVVARGMDFPGVSHVFQVGIPADKESYIHRLGRTARADTEGRGVFITTAVESFFPQKILQEIPFVETPADLSSAPQVLASARTFENKQKVYQAWMGYYKNSCNSFQWSTGELVRQANKLALQGLGCDEVPEMDRQTLGKMGLKNVPGLVIGPPRQRGQPRQNGGGGYF